MCCGFGNHKGKGRWPRRDSWPSSRMMQYSQDLDGCSANPVDGYERGPGNNQFPSAGHSPGPSNVRIVYEVLNCFVYSSGHSLGRFGMVESYVFTRFVEITDGLVSPFKAHPLFLAPFLELLERLLVGNDPPFFGVRHALFDGLHLPLLDCHKLFDCEGRKI